MIKLKTVCSSGELIVGAANMIAARAKSFTAGAAVTFVLIADGATAADAYGNGRRGALDGSLRSEGACDNAIAPTFGLDDEAHRFPLH